MAIPRLDELHPNSSVDGVQINYDLANPVSCTAYDNAGGLEIVHQLQADTDILSIVADADLYIGFEPKPVSIRNVVGVLVLANERAMVIKPNKQTEIFIAPIAVGTACSIYINELQAWTGLGYNTEDPDKL